MASWHDAAQVDMARPSDDMLNRMIMVGGSISLSAKVMSERPILKGSVHRIDIQIKHQRTSG
jgi:hypothetical protein